MNCPVCLMKMKLINVTMTSETYKCGYCKCLIKEGEDHEMDIFTMCDINDRLCSHSEKHNN